MLFFCVYSVFVEIVFLPFFMGWVIIVCEESKINCQYVESYYIGNPSNVFSLR